MKYFDRYKLSLHNINNNKSRFILTTIIVYIISLLLTVILSIGISFSLNTNNIIKKYYSEATEFVVVSYFSGEYSTIINNSNYSGVYDVILKHDSSISYSLHNANLFDNNLVLVAFYFFNLHGCNLPCSKGLCKLISLRLASKRTNHIFHYSVYCSLGNVTRCLFPYHSQSLCRKHIISCNGYPVDIVVFLFKFPCILG